MTTQQQTAPQPNTELEELLGTVSKPKKESKETTPVDEMINREKASLKKQRAKAAPTAVDTLIEKVRTTKKAQPVAKPKTLGDLMKKAQANKATKKGGGKKAPQADSPPAPKAKPAVKGGASAKGAAKPAKAMAKPATKARGNGQYSRYVEAAIGKLKSLKAGAVLTTRELALKHDIPPYAFLAAAHKLEALEEVKLKNKDRINTITRL